ncbi:MAG: radical SAM protein [Deltaproteobacteria bacterium]|nr:radical SAM protein [Deltaproteobacteria bacterium]
MANFILTNVCNLNCPFCFASEFHEEESSKNTSRMSLSEFKKQLNFIGEQPARFCGGEPTLHPEFIEMLDLALDEPKRQVFLMSNGVWPAKVREHLFSLSRGDQKRVGFLFNVLSPTHYREEQLRTLHATLAEVRKDRVTLGVTFCEATADYSHVFSLVEQYGFPRLRYSVAAPNVTDAKSWNVDVQRDFSALAQIVYDVTMAAKERALSIHSDCGYIPPCFFSEEQLAEMYPKQDELKAEAFGCRGPVDIGPGGESWRCYGLYSSMRARTDSFDDVGALAEHFEIQTAQTHYPPLLKECGDCEIRERYACAGGCYALRSVMGMQEKAASALVSIGDNPSFFGAKAALQKDKVLLRQDASSMMQEADGTWTELSLSTWESEILQSCDGKQRVREIAEQAQESLRDRGSTRKASRVIRRFYELGIIELSK